MGKVNYHPNYDEYVEMIVAHPNYKGLYYDRGKDGRVNWVVAGKSAKGQIRQKWWDKKCEELNMPIQRGCFAEVARKIHPTGLHVCQCCGEARSIFYEYPTKNTAKLLNKILGTDIDPDDDEQRAECTIKEIVLGWCDSDFKLKALAKAFKLPIPKTKEELIDSIYERMVAVNSSNFSPGVMSNPPDRYNGFHSYALCCRTKYDHGRWTENMNTYIQDRRAYEEWADGDYNLANRLMGEFQKQLPMECPHCHKIAKMTADHIGPISLGFCHSKHFAPMCKRCNSSKNNRFTKSDVDELLKLEAKGEQVVSWHAKYIWDTIKPLIKNDEDAKKASSIMVKCHQNVLNLLSLIYRLSKNGREFLLHSYLHPEYSLVDYRFENVDLYNLSELTIISTPLESKNKHNNQERYIRIAFESLEKFSLKDNRKNYLLINENSPELKAILFVVNSKNYDIADKRVRELINDISRQIAASEWNIVFYNSNEPQMQIAADNPVG